MNTIFIKEISTSVIKKRLVRFDINKLSDKLGVIEINISDRVLDEISKNRKYIQNSNIVRNNITFGNRLKSLKNNVTEIRFKRSLVKIIKKNKLEGYSVVFSNDLKKKKVKEYIESILVKFDICEYLCKNTMELNFEKYIDEFKSKNNLKTENIVPLIMVNDLEKLNFDIIDALNGKYKELGIFCIGKVDKSFQNRIKDLNDDTGSCIQIVNKNTKNLKGYNVCILIDISRENIVKYKFNKKTCYIDFTNKENDKFNNNYLLLQKNIKDGKYNSIRIKELYNMYGKVTVSNAIID